MRTMLFILWLLMFASVGLAGCVPQEVQPAISTGEPVEKVTQVPLKDNAPARAEAAPIVDKVPGILTVPTAPVQAQPDALESAKAFMTWYIAYLKDHQSADGELFYPFEEDAHKSTDLFTETYMDKIDQILAIPVLERGLFDPLMHQWGFYENYSLEQVYLDNESATIAVKLESFDLPSWAGATLDLVRTEAGWKIDDIRPENIASPVGVTKLFYSWYFESFRVGGNPLKDEAFKSSEYLSDSFIAQVAEGQAGPDHSAIDPFVLSLEIPRGGSIMEEAVIKGNRATVMFWRYFYSSQSQPLLVHLEKFNETWKITGVGLEEAPLNPIEVVEAFYEWYLDYTKADSEGNFRNALVEGAYRTSPYLSENFITKIDQRDQSYDPLLCAQDIPTSILTDGFFIEKLHAPGESTHASIVVRTSFPGHIFTVDLARPGGKLDEWKIEDVTCSFSPEGTVKAFYTWYQSCQEESLSCRIPGAQESYPSTGLVAEGFVEKVEALQAEFTRTGGFGYDPILMAQEGFYAFDVKNVYETHNPALGASRARVFLRNLNRPDQSMEESGLLVTLVKDSPFWKIDNVSIYFPNTPEQTAAKFYTWYANILRAERNPQVLFGFEPEAYLSTGYMKEVSSALVSERMEGYNAILLADRLPEKMEVGEVIVEDDTADLTLLRYFAGEDSPSEMRVLMEKLDGWWVITGAEEK
jgi:hypothetical protein